MQTLTKITESHSRDDGSYHVAKFHENRMKNEKGDKGTGLSTQNGAKNHKITVAEQICG